MRKMAFVSLVAWTLVACSGGAPDAGPPLEGDARVTYRSDAVVIAPDDAKRALLAEAEDDSTFLLDPSVPGVTDIAPGKAFLLGGLALRHADKVEQQGANVLVTTSPAAITDVVEEGHLGWDGAVDFHTGQVKASPGGVSPADISNSIGGSVGSWTFSLGQTIKDDGTLEVSLTGERKPIAKAYAKLTIRRPQLHGSIDISNHVADNAELAMKAISADITVGWMALNNGDRAAFAEIVNIPASQPFPFMVGFIPMYFSIGVNFAMAFGLIGASASASGSLTFHVMGEDSHTSSGGQQTSDGTGSGDGTLGQDTQITTVAGSALGLAFQVPKFSVGLGVSGVASASYYISVANKIDIKSSGVLAGVVPCTEVDYKATLSHGIEWQFLGINGKTSQDLKTLVDSSASSPPGYKCGG